MRICLFRDVPGQGENSRPLPTLLNVSRLTIGSSTDQHLQLPVEGVERRHAVITMGFGRRLVLRTKAKGVTVNERKVKSARLRPGDRIQIGKAIITVMRPLASGEAVLRISEQGQLQWASAVGPGEAPTTGKTSISSWSWTLTVSVSIIFLLIPLAGTMVPAVGKVLHSAPLLPSDSSWNPGPLFAAHQTIATCDACHSKSFAAVADEQCAACHADVQHHVNVNTPDVALFADQRCVDCHREHKQPAALVQTDPRLCTDCHANLETRKPHPDPGNVTDFGKEHPEFRLTVLASVDGRDWQPQRLNRDKPNFVEKSHLRFSHRQHLSPRGIDSPAGRRFLDCGDCHHPDASGRELMPIRMVSQCSGCHSLRFDEADPTSTLPHGDLPAVIRSLRERFARQYLERNPQLRLKRAAGDSTRRLPADDEAALPLDAGAQAFVNEQTLKVVREVMETNICSECHEITKDPTKTGVDQYRVTPVRLTAIWMPNARFNHAAHSQQKCTVCHEAAPNSEHATDILVPAIAKCRECHGGVSDTTKVASNCLMCHQFHLPDHGRFMRAKLPAAGGSPEMTIPARLNQATPGMRLGPTETTPMGQMPAQNAPVPGRSMPGAMPPPPAPPNMTPGRPPVSTPESAMPPPPKGEQMAPESTTRGMRRMPGT